MDKTVITIGRQYGSGGRIIARRLAKRLGIPYYDKEIVENVARETGFTEQYVEELGQRMASSYLYDMFFSSRGPDIPDQVYIAQSKFLCKAAEEGPCVIVGRCGGHILRDFPHHLSVFVCAPMEERIERARTVYRIENSNMRSYVQRRDKQREAYYNYFAQSGWGEVESYDLCINSHMGLDEAAAVIERAALEVDRR